MIQLAALIDGKPVATEAEVPVEDPSTGEVMAVTADCGPAEVDAAVRAAAAAASSWRLVSVPGRAGEPADRQAAASGPARRRDHRAVLRLLRQRGRDFLRQRVLAGRADLGADPLGAARGDRA